MAYDGSIIFSTKIDDKGFESGAKNLSSKVLALKNKISSTRNEIEKLSRELAQIGNEPIKSNEAISLEKTVATTENKLRNLYTQADKIGDGVKSDLLSMGFDLKYLDNILAQNSGWQKLQAEIDKTEILLDEYKQKLQQVSANQQIGKDTEEYQRKQQKLQSLTDKLGVYETQLSEVKSKEQATADATQKSNKDVSRYTATLKAVKKALGNLVTVLGRVCSRLKSAFSTVIANQIKKIGRNTSKTNSQMNLFAKALKRIKTAIVGMLFYKVISSAINSLKDGINQLVKVCPTANKQMSELMSSLTYLKSSLAAAFAPILTVITPIITKFVDNLSLAINKIGQFIAALTGQKTYTKAIKVQKDYAKSLDKTAASTQDLTDANNKNLASFDELNVMQADSGSKTSASADDDDVSNYVTVPTMFSDFANKLKDAIKKQDFSEIGQLIADKLNISMKKINWTKIRKTTQKWALNIANLINGFVKEINWNLLGETIADGINTATNFVNKLIGKNGIKFKKIGVGISKGLNNVIKKLDEKALGEALANSVNMIISFADGFSYNFNWDEFGEKIRRTLKSFFHNLDLTGAKNAFVNTINGLISSALNMIGSPNFEQWGIDTFNSLKETLQKINWEDISKLFTVLINGTLSFVDGIAISIDWKELGENILTSFSDFFGDGGDGYNIIKKLGQTFYDLFFGALTALDTIINGTDWEDFGKNLSQTFNLDTSDNGWVAKLSKAASDIVNALLKFINGVFGEQSSADKVAEGFSTMLNNIDWEEIFINALSAIFNIGSWLTKLAEDLITDFCDGMAIGFDNGKNDNKLRNAAEGLMKSIGNLIITVVELVLNLLVNAIPNFIIGLLKSLLTAIAGIVGLFFGEDFFNSATSGLWGEDSWHSDFKISLPRLATGTVIPANYGEFLAVLGDNKREAEVVSPISAMKQAMAEVLSEFGGTGDGGNIYLTVELDGNVVYQNVVDHNDRYKIRHGKSRLA